MVPNRRCAARHKTVIEKEINSSTIPRIKYVVLPLDLDRKKKKKSWIYSRNISANGANKAVRFNGFNENR